MAAPTPKCCRLQELLGCVELCPATACALWDPGDATHEGHCAIADLDLARRPEVAAWLLRIRKELETVSTSEQRESALRHFAEARDLITRSSRAPRRH
jgi:hypothetical protein